MPGALPSALSALLPALSLAACAPLTPAQEATPGAIPRADTPALLAAYRTDREALQRFYDLPLDPERRKRLIRFQRAWRARLDAMDFDSLPRERQVDWLCLSGTIDARLADLDRGAERDREALTLLPFAPSILDLERTRRAMKSQDPEATAAAVAALAQAVEEQGESLAEAKEEPSPALALRCAGLAERLAETLDAWYRFSDGFDPLFTWWNEEPHRKAARALRDYAKELREDYADQKGEADDPLVGDPIGRDALLEAIAAERLPYGPEELLAIGEAQFAWCEARMREAAAEMGLGDDWHAALERVKQDHVPPGRQDELVAKVAHESIAFLDAHDLVTIPPLCRETWRVEMIPFATQRNYPFAFYGGQHMAVAYASEDMSEDSKLQSMRGNNVHFTRNVTPHELIPGHHLQGFQAARLRPWRRTFSTPFLVEGWALYWEMRYWDLGWARTPEDRIGMLFWRMHRAARIIVSLKFHLGRMTPAEMVDFLVERVGHERDGATGEVRRYIGGDYGPLYQCGYLIGGLQLRALHEELVTSGRMSERAFHDAVLGQNSIPVALIRAALEPELALDRAGGAPWRFAGDPLTK